MSKQINTEYFGGTICNTYPQEPWNAIKDFGSLIAITPTTLSNLEDCEFILNPRATIIRDRKNKGRKAVVKKCSLDEMDLEKAFMYAFLKMHGITPKMIQRAIDKAVVQKDKADEKKTKSV